MTAFNGLMISGLARGFVALGEKELANRAVKAVNFVKEHLYCAEGNGLIRCVYVNEKGEIVHKYSLIFCFFCVSAIFALYITQFQVFFSFLDEVLFK